MSKKYTKEDFTAFLSLLKEYSGWMYYHPDGIKRFENTSISYQNDTLSIKLTEYGIYQIVSSNGKSAEFEVYSTTTKPYSGTIDNIQYFVRHRNESEVSFEDKEYFKDAQWFVLSAFQRANAFTFLSRMAEPTINLMANDFFICQKDVE